MARRSAQTPYDTLRTLENKAFELFGRFGYEGVSVGDIAKAARLSKGALYWHFPNKEMLFLRCLEHLHHIFEVNVFAAMHAESDPGRSILALFTGIGRMLKDPRVELGVAGYWLIPARPQNETLIAAQRDFEKRSAATVRDCLQRGIDAGIIDLHGDTLDELTSGIMAVVEACVLPLRQLTPEEIRGTLRALARTLFRAYSTSPRTIGLIEAI